MARNAAAGSSDVESAPAWVRDADIGVRGKALISHNATRKVSGQWRVYGIYERSFPTSGLS